MRKLEKANQREIAAYIDTTVQSILDAAKIIEKGYGFLECSNFDDYNRFEEALSLIEIACGMISRVVDGVSE